MKTKPKGHRCYYYEDPIIFKWLQKHYAKDNLKSKLIRDFTRQLYEKERKNVGNNK